MAIRLRVEELSHPLPRSGGGDKTVLAPLIAKSRLRRRCDQRRVPEGNRSTAGEIGAQGGLRLALQPLVLRIIDFVGERPALDVGMDPGLDRGEAGRAVADLDIDAGDAGFSEERTEARRIAKPERRPEFISDALAEKPLQQ